MMSKNSNSVAAKQLRSFTASAQLGLGLLILPTELALEAGHDGWLSTAGGSFIVIIIIFIMRLFMKRYGDKSLLDINKCLYGRFPGTFINLLILAYLSFGAILGLRLFTDVIKITVLRLTPSIVLASFIFIPAAYLCWFGFKAICRFANNIYVIVISVILIIAMTAGEMELDFLLPVGEKGLEPLLSGTVTTITLYLGIELVPILYSEITDKDKAFKYVFQGHLLTTIFSIIVIAASVLLYGEEMLQQMSFSLFQIFRVYKSELLERVDLFFNAIWFPAMGASMLAYYFTAYYTISKIFKDRKKGVIFTIFMAAVILLSRIPKDFEETLKALELFGLIGMIFLVFISASYFFSFINKAGVQRK